MAMVTGESTVTVTREEQHQDVLARYTPAPGGERTVAVELAWCVIASGKYKGERAIEVRLDGRRVGELTYLMSQRYATLVGDVQAHGGRAGCAAAITRDARGLQLTLLLPRDPELVSPSPVVDPPTVAFPVPAPARAAVPVAAKASGSTFTKHRAAWITAAAVLVVLVFVSVINSNNDDTPTRNIAADETTTTTTVELPTTTPTTPPPTTTPTTTPPPPPPTTTAVVQPPPLQPTIEQPAPPPPVEPAPQPQCDPNYTGCVPIASDVDCAGGSGNGPAYVKGPVQVIGNDIYELDKDHDGTACE
ncbi:hypothetical protein [Actinophytocola sp.]|uniref:hypothetical protein n=1 Tax=Actinophytocola sp. TaxID=1872138 RepID=UPI002D41C9F6|nr:hypothetical protein [Actinophytocola sp.]HYQ65193.1 hypothetical protein [Actinophytocola sp.]